MDERIGQGGHQLRLVFAADDEASAVMPSQVGETSREDVCVFAARSDNVSMNVIDTTASTPPGGGVDPGTNAV